MTSNRMRDGWIELSTEIDVMDLYTPLKWLALCQTLKLTKFSDRSNFAVF